jgi:uncharacterized protein (TIGR00369 family)
VSRQARLNPEWVRALREVANPCPYFRLQSMTIAELAPGRSRLELELGEKHLQPFGIVHGGVFATLVDAAGFWASYAELAEGPGLTTVEMKLNYLAPAKGGRLVGLGQSLKVGRSLALAEARVEDAAGRLAAHGTVTMMVLPELRLEGQDRLPPKFL